jgi:hypothetical protein
MKSKTFYNRVAAKNDRIQLTPKKDRASRRKELIEQFKNGWASAGLALQELKDDEHWKDTHTSWIAFCKDNFGISKTKLWEILKYTEVVGSLSKDNQTKIAHIDQALALLKAPEKERNKIVEKAENNGGLAADNLRFHIAKPASKTKANVPPGMVRNSEPSSSETTESEMVSKPKNETKPEVKKKEPTVVDDVETPIPLDAMPYAIRQKEVARVLKSISDLRVEIKKKRDGGDHLWVKHGQDAYEYLSRAYSYISDASPDCVCLMCQGTYSMQKDGCNTCGNTGMISQYRFDHFLPKGLREIRLQSNADYAKTHETTKTRPNPE